MGNKAQTNTVQKEAVQIEADHFGTVGDGHADDTLAIQVALDSLADAFEGGTVRLNPTKRYKITGNGLIVPPNITLDCRHALIRYTGEATAITLGHGADTISHQPQALNIKVKLHKKQSTGVVLYGTVQAKVTGFIEGHTAVMDDSRSNVGVFIDGANVSSYHNHIEVRCNQMHQGFRTGSTGSLVPTTQFYCRTQSSQCEPMLL